MQNAEKADRRSHSAFCILHSAFVAAVCNSQTPLWRYISRHALRRRMGSGGLRGLQNRCFGAEASKGWFDSDAPPPNKAEGRRQKAEVLAAMGPIAARPSAFCLLPSALFRRRLGQEADL